MRFSLLRKFDWILFGITVAILTLGLATFYAMGPESHGVFVRHMTFIGIGIFVMFMFSFVDYRILKNYSLPSVILYIFVAILLIIALASQEIRGSSAWLHFMGFQFEPSEAMKLALILLFAKYFSQKHVEIYNLRHILVSAVYLSIPTILTFLQPDLGSVIVYVAIWISMLIFSGIKRKHMLAIFMVLTVLASLGWFLVLKPYQRSRIVSFANPYADPSGSGYHTIQSQVTLGSGKILGTFLSKDREKTPVLVPEPYTDFTFATFAQKFGLLGVMILFVLIGALIIRVGDNAFRTSNNFAKLFSLGFLVMLFSHVVVNGGMNLGVLPITGIPFPLLSHGGSHMITLMAGLGIIQSIKIRGNA